MVRENRCASEGFDAEMTETFKDLGKRLSNWGRWGADDQKGTLNLITAEMVREASA